MPSRFANSAITDFLELIGLSATAPAVDRLRLFVKTIAGRCTPAVKDTDGIETLMASHPAYHKYAIWRAANSSAGAPVANGIAAFAFLGSAGPRAFATTNIVTRRSRLGYVSAPAVNSFCGNYATAVHSAIGNGTLGGFHYVVKFNVADAAAVAGARMFVGLRGVVTAPTNVEPNTLTNQIGVAKLSTSNNLFIVWGGTTAQVAIDLGVGFPASDPAAAYTLTLYNSPLRNNVVKYHLAREGTAFTASSTLTGVAGTAIPVNTLGLAHTAWRTNNATLLAVALDIDTVFIA